MHGRAISARIHATVAEEKAYSREAALFACLAAWLLGIGTGVVLVRTFGADGPKPAGADTSSTPAPVRRAADPPVAPSPSPSDWTTYMQFFYQGDCPKIVLREIRVRDGANERTVTMTMRVTNGYSDRSCAIPGERMFVRDGDGNTFRHEGGDITVAALGAKIATLEFKLPRRLEIAQFVMPDGQGQLRASDFDLVPPQAYRR